MHFPCVIGLGSLGLSQPYKQQLSIFYLTDMVHLMQYCYISCFCFMFLYFEKPAADLQICLRPTLLDIATALETLEQLHWKTYLVENCHFIEKPIAAPPHNDRFSDLVT